MLSASPMWLEVLPVEVNGETRYGVMEVTRYATGLGFVGTPVNLMSGVRNFRIYQLRKYGADSAVIYVDGVRRTSAVYSTLPASKNVVTGPSYVEFGMIGGTVRTTTSTWDYVVYQIGQATP